MILTVNPLKDSGKAPPAAVLKEVCVSAACINLLGTHVSAASMLACQHLCFMPPRNMYRLIRPQAGTAVLIAQPGSNGLLGEIFLSHRGDWLIFVSKNTNPSWPTPYRKLFSESNNFTPEPGGIFMMHWDQ